MWEKKKQKNFFEKKKICNCPFLYSKESKCHPLHKIWRYKRIAKLGIEARTQVTVLWNSLEAEINKKQQQRFSAVFEDIVKNNCQTAGWILFRSDDNGMKAVVVVVIVGSLGHFSV